MRQILLLAVMSLMATASPARTEQDGVASGAPFYEHGSARTDIAAQSEGPRRPALLPFLYGSSIFFQGYDTASTLAGMRAGAVEANPFMKAITQRPALFVLVKSGVTAAPIIGAERLWRNNHRVEAVMMLVVSNAIMGSGGPQRVCPHERSIDEIYP